MHLHVIKIIGTLLVNYSNQMNQSERGINDKPNKVEHKIAESFNSTINKDSMTNFYALISNPR